MEHAGPSPNVYFGPGQGQISNSEEYFSYGPPVALSSFRAGIKRPHDDGLIGMEYVSTNFHGQVAQTHMNAATAASSAESSPLAIEQWQQPSQPLNDPSASVYPYQQYTDPNIEHGGFQGAWQGPAHPLPEQNLPPDPSQDTSNMSYLPVAQRNLSLEQGGHPMGVELAMGRSMPLDEQVVPYSALSPNGETAALRTRLYDGVTNVHSRAQSLALLDNLATQLIQMTARTPFTQIQEIMQQRDTKAGQEYGNLKLLFDQTRRIYSTDTPFIDAIAIHMFSAGQQESIRRANIATFICSILGAHDMSFYHLNEFFVETFVPLGHRLLKWQGAVYLELKTQCYISALMNSGGHPEAMLEEIFPSDLDAQIISRHPEASSLSPSEQDFLDRSRARRNYLLAESDLHGVRELPRKYQWQDFVREFALCINKNIDSVMNVPARAAQAIPGLGPGGGTSHTQGARGTQQLSNTSSNGGGAAAVGNGKPVAGPASDDRSEGGTRKQSTATATVRQPWTKPEEDALIDGLSRVNGPHWSQILILYGRGGSVSEVLKDRNQVQLKDKARNLKLWYLKMGKDVPAALQGVTGELRKRGGARARAALSAQEGDDDADGEAVTDDGNDPRSARTGDGLSKKRKGKTGGL